jgi:hypothetical protein
VQSREAQQHGGRVRWEKETGKRSSPRRSHGHERITESVGGARGR